MIDPGFVVVAKHEVATGRYALIEPPELRAQLRDYMRQIRLDLVDVPVRTEEQRATILDERGRQLVRVRPHRYAHGQIE